MQILPLEGSCDCTTFFTKMRFPNRVSGKDSKQKLKDKTTKKEMRERARK